jgi:hypothetical protein
MAAGRDVGTWVAVIGKPTFVGTSELPGLVNASQCPCSFRTSHDFTSPTSTAMNEGRGQVNQ